jgi:AcrR family transcriptional regulator
VTGGYDQEVVSSRVPLREQQRAFTRGRLLDSAREVFGELGYIESAFTAIAPRPLATRATFYLHFRSKAELTTALLANAERFAVERYEALDALLTNSSGHTKAELRDWLAGWLDLWRASSGLNAAIQQAASIEPGVEERQIALSQGLIATLEATFSRWPAETRAQARERALMLEVMTQRLFYLAAHGGLPVSNDALLDFLSNLWQSHFVSPDVPNATRSSLD